MARPVTFKNLGKAFGSVMVPLCGVDASVDNILANVFLVGLNSPFMYGTSWMSLTVVVIPLASFASVFRDTVHST